MALPFSRELGFFAFGTFVGGTGGTGCYYWLTRIPQETLDKAKKNIRVEEEERGLKIVAIEPVEEEEESGLSIAYADGTTEVQTKTKKTTQEAPLIQQQEVVKKRQVLTLTDSDYEAYKKAVEDENARTEKTEDEIRDLKIEYEEYKDETTQWFEYFRTHTIQCPSREFKDICGKSKKTKYYTTWRSGEFRASIFERGWRLKELKTDFKETDKITIVNIENREEKLVDFRDVFYISEKKAPNEPECKTSCGKFDIDSSISSYRYYKTRVQLKTKPEFCTSMKNEFPGVDVECKWGTTSTTLSLKPVARNEDVEMVIIFPES